MFHLTNIVTVDNDLTLISTVQMALRNSADAVAVQVMNGSPHERHMLENFRVVVDRCERWGMPVVAMMYLTAELFSRRGHDAELLAAWGSVPSLGPMLSRRRILVIGRLFQA